MRAALFVPCYVDQLWPEVGLAAVELLEALGVDLVFPEDQTCCGQPFLTAGFPAEARAPGAALRRRLRQGGPHRVSVGELRGDGAPPVRGAPRRRAARRRGARGELCEFLVDVLGVAGLPVRFPHRVGLHPSCHGLRELGLARPSERPGAGPDKVALAARDARRPRARRAGARRRVLRLRRQLRGRRGGRLVPRWASTASAPTRRRARRCSPRPTLRACCISRPRRAPALAAPRDARRGDPRRARDARVSGAHPGAAGALPRRRPRARLARPGALVRARASATRAAAALPEWEALRDRAAAIKAPRVAHLDEYLEQFESNALPRGRAGPLGPRRGRAQRDRARPAARSGRARAS